MAARVRNNLFCSFPAANSLGTYFLIRAEQCHQPSTDRPRDTAGAAEAVSPAGLGTKEASGVLMLSGILSGGKRREAICR